MMNILKKLLCKHQWCVHSRVLLEGNPYCEFCLICQNCKRRKSVAIKCADSFKARESVRKLMGWEAAWELAGDNDGLFMKTEDKNMDYDPVEEVMDNFDFERVHEVMTLMDWRWSSLGCVPTITELKAKAQQLLTDVNEKGDSTHSSGGFRAERYEDYLRLTFEIRDYEAII